MIKKIFLLVFLNFILFSCNSDNITNIQDFKEFIVVFEKAIKNRDKATLKKIIDEKFYIDFPEILPDGHRKTYEGKKGIDNLDFALIEDIIKTGYKEDVKGKSAMSPPPGKQNKSHAIYFINRGKGWRIQSIDAAPGGAM